MYKKLRKYAETLALAAKNGDCGLCLCVCVCLVLVFCFSGGEEEEGFCLAVSCFVQNRAVSCQVSREQGRWGRERERERERERDVLVVICVRIGDDRGDFSSSSMFPF